MTLKIGVFDTETTGLTKHPDVDFRDQPRIIEWAGLITDGTDILLEDEFVCTPGFAVDAVITKITGLTNDFLDTKQPFIKHAHQIKDFFAECDVVIAHNLPFDKQMVFTEAQWMGQTLEDFFWPKIEVCTVEATMAQFGHRMKLQQLYEIACGPYVQKHRALDDVKMLHAVCQHFGVYQAIIDTHGIPQGLQA